MTTNHMASKAHKLASQSAVLPCIPTYSESWTQHLWAEETS